MKTKHFTKVVCLLSLICAPVSQQIAYAAKLWSTSETFLGSGEFYGPGAFTAQQPLFEIVLNNLSFFTPVDFITPFFNNGESEPNICAEREREEKPDGKLSNGLLINENASLCLATIAGTEIMFAVVQGGPHQGQQLNVTLDDGNIVMTMDLALDLGIGEKGVVKLPFYGTTGSLTVPVSLQTALGEKGIDQAGKFPAGTVLQGRIGDFNNDGWIDGTLVAAGNIPLDSPIFPGQPYAMHRNFETNISIKGILYGNVKALVEKESLTYK